jgi:hypothetical protein
MTTFLTGILAGGLLAAGLAWLDEEIRHRVQRRRAMRYLRRQHAVASDR